MNYIEVTPAYGRDYKSAKEVIAAWNEGKDFLIASIDSGYAGSYINKDDAHEGDVILLRYKRLTQVTPVKVKR
jgi:hypothetical protein